MKKTLKILGLSVGAVIGILSVVPFFINLNDYKSQIEEKISTTLGRAVSMEGISLTFLPTPSLTLKQLKIANAVQGQMPYFATVDSLKAGVALLPLLQKRLYLHHIIVKNPEVSLELNQGQGNWLFPGQNTLVPAEKAENSVSLLESPNQDFDLAIDQIDILGGHIIYRDKDTVYELKDLTTSARLDSLKGPMNANGYVKILDYDLRFDVKVRDFGDDLPLKISLDTVGLDVTLDGNLSVAKKIFKGDIDVTTQADVLAKITQNNSFLGAILKDSLSFKAFVVASSESVQMQNVELEVDAQKVTGLASLSYTPLQMDIDLRGFPGGTSLVLALAPKGPQTQGKISIDSSNPKKFLRWLNLAVEKIDDDFASKLKVSSDVRVSDTLVSFKNLSLAYRQASFDGDVSYDYGTLKAIYDVSFNNLSSLLQILGITLQGDPGRISVKGKTDLKGGIKTQTLLNVNGTQLNLDGLVGPVIDSKIKITSSDLNPLFQALTGESAPLRSVLLTGNLKGKGAHLSWQNLQASLGLGQGKIPVQGQLDLDYKEHPKISGDILIPDLKTDLLVSSPSKMQEIRGTKKESSTKKTVVVSDYPQDLWAKAPLNFSFLKAFDMDLKLTVPNLSYKDWRVHDFKGSVKVVKGVLTLDDAHGNCFGGAFQFESVLENSKSPSFKILASLKNAQVKRLLPDDQGSIKITDGNLDVLANFSSTGQSLNDWIHHLKGRFSFKGQNGVIQGFDLKAINNKLQNLKNMTGIIDLFATAFSKGQTRFDSLTGDIEFEKGIGTLTKCLLSADGGAGTASGTVSLPSFVLDVNGSFQLADLPQFPPFQFRVFGPLDDPKKQLDTKALEAYMLQNVFKGILNQTNLKNSVGGILGNLLGGAPSSQKTPTDGTKPPPQAQPSQETSIENLIKKPEKALKNVLKGLF